MRHNPLAFLCRVKLDPPSPADKTGDADRLISGLEKAGITDVTVPLEVLRRLPDELRRNNFQLKLVLGLQKDSLRILDIGRDDIYGLALDIGSTNIECSLLNLVTGEKVGRKGADNGQVKFGSDVLTRVQRSMKGEFSVLKKILSDSIDILIKGVCNENNISPEDIFAVTVAGNTIMSHFFLGLAVDNIPISPYIPAVNRAFFASAGEIGLAVNEKAVVYVFPNAGSYVGGDIISGMIFTGIYREEEPVLFIDVGTNVEITLGCADWIMVGAGAAGPALEGGVASIGRKADKGAISAVRIDGISREIELDVISDAVPSGICGSGLVDLVSELFSAKIINQAGRFIGAGNGVVEKDGVKAFLLNKSGKEGLYLTETEIRNFLLSKAAMFSFLYVFVRSVGLTFRDIKKIYISGALGCGLNPESAINIGMFPDIPRERFIPRGNSSLGGAEMVLLDRNLLTKVDDITAKVTYREMNEDPELMNILQGAMFMPHTEPEILKG